MPIRMIRKLSDQVPYGELEIRALVALIFSLPCAALPSPYAHGVLDPAFVWWQKRQLLKARRDQYGGGWGWLLGWFSTVNDRAGIVGASSEGIAMALSGLRELRAEIRTVDLPFDYYDFRRCVWLLDWAHENGIDWYSQLSKLGQKYPRSWGKLIPHWDKLIELYQLSTVSMFTYDAATAYQQKHGSRRVKVISRDPAFMDFLTRVRNA